MSSAWVWYAARAGGIVAYVLVTASVVVGILHSSRRVRVLPRFAFEDMHRFLGLLAGAFIAIHVGGILLDQVVPFSVAQLVVPFTADYRPLATGLGVVALELLLALALSNLLREHLPHRVWRTLHGANFAVWGLATVHAATAGSNRDQLWASVLYALSSALVVGTLAWRLREARPGLDGVGRGLLAACAVAVVVVGLTRVPMTSSGSSTAASTSTVAFTARSLTLDGEVEQESGPTARLISVVDRAAGPDSVRIDLLQTREQTTTSLQLRQGRAVCRGTIETLDESGFAGTCTVPGETTLHRVSGSWRLSGDAVSGTVTVSGPESGAPDSAAGRL